LSAENAKRLREKTVKVEASKRNYECAEPEFAAIEKQIEAAKAKIAEQSITKSVATARLEKVRSSLKALGTGVCSACERPFTNQAEIKHQRVLLDAEVQAEQAILTVCTREIAIATATQTNHVSRLAELKVVIDAHATLLRELSQLELAVQNSVTADNSEEIAACEVSVASNTERAAIVSARVLVLDAQVSVLQTEVADYESIQFAVKNLQGDVLAAQSRLNHANERWDTLGTEHATSAEQIEILKLSVAENSVKLSLYTRAVECLDRTGIPAYLCGMLCPTLTKAAEEYAKLFSDDAMQVVFEFVDGEFDCKVINGQGSSTIQGLSTGERATAALITAFALRSAAPKTNLLVLDEPGRGLDELGQKKFAEALGVLKDSFETILVTTHEKSMETALPADTVLTIVKENKVSRIEL
jgi:DNA repair exonuclease SbcCD ATPase subunit